jgi:hypothetical protein
MSKIVVVKQEVIILQAQKKGIVFIDGFAPGVIEVSEIRITVPDKDWRNSSRFLSTMMNKEGKAIEENVLVRQTLVEEDA